VVGPGLAVGVVNIILTASGEPPVTKRMIKNSLIFLLVFLSNTCCLFGQVTSTIQDTLPDNYLAFSLDILDDRLEGTNEYLEGRGGCGNSDNSLRWI
jgi:hypothetical protein